VGEGTLTQKRFKKMSWELQDSLPGTCSLNRFKDIQKAQPKQARAIHWIIGSPDSDNIYIAESTRKRTRSWLEQFIEAGKGNQIFITLLPIWLLGQRSGNYYFL